MLNMFSLQGKVALITGSAHGIGYSIAKALYNAGAKIIINSSNYESLNNGLNNLLSEGISIRDLLTIFETLAGMVTFCSLRQL